MLNLTDYSEKNFYSFKIDMAADIVTEPQFIEFQNLSQKNNKKFAIKICGCDAVTDISYAKRYNADIIAAPMIETDYALRKFVEACQVVYSKQLSKVELYINIETLTAYNNLDSILQSPYIQCISGIILGRDDMAKSMNLSIEEINSEEMFKIVLNVAQKVAKYDKKFVLGGCIRPQAVPFLMRIPQNLLFGYETRLIGFDTNSMNEKKLHDNIRTALEFEIKWLELKENSKTDATISYKERIENLKKYL